MVWAKELYVDLARRYSTCLVEITRGDHRGELS